jgi:hypothetical protein
MAATLRLEPVPSGEDADSEMEQVGALAAELMAQLYAVAAGGRPRVARAYHEDDALLLLLRFEPAHLSESKQLGSPLSEAALMALPDMIASAVHAQSGYRHRLIPGSLTISSDHSVVSLGFSVVLGTDDSAETLTSATGGSDWPSPRLALVG